MSKDEDIGPALIRAIKDLFKETLKTLNAYANMTRKILQRDKILTHNPKLFARLVLIITFRSLADHLIDTCKQEELPMLVNAMQHIHDYAGE